MNLSLSEILEMWKEDGQIKELELDQASMNTPMLHAKYVEIHAMYKLKLKKKNYAFLSLAKNKWLWYAGKLSKEQMDKFGWNYDPLNGLKVLKGDMDKFLETDEDIMKSQAEIDYLKTIIDTLDEIVQQIKWRHQSIKNAIEYKKFMSGM